MPIEGGLRARLIRDSLHSMLEDALTEIGWFDSGRTHKTVNFLDRPNSWNEQIELNSLIVTFDDDVSEEAEMGSMMTDDTYTYYIDLFAESNDLGEHLSGDIRDILRGKMEAASRTRPSLTVYDYSLATPTEAFTCQIEEVIRDKAEGYEKPWQKHWFVVRCDVVDSF